MTKPTPTTTEADFRHWLATSLPGDVCIYHRATGPTTGLRAAIIDAPEADAKRLHFLRAATQAAWFRRDVELVQRRMSGGDLLYEAHRVSREATEVIERYADTLPALALKETEHYRPMGGEPTWKRR